jgi:autotransporter-associated beta strand protein
VVINGGILQCEKASDLVGPLTLNGATVIANCASTNLNYRAAGYTNSYLSFQLVASVTVTGSSPSIISNSQTSFGVPQDGISLTNGATTFTVADVTGNASVDLTIQAAIGDVNADYSTTGTKIGGVLVKAGPGTMLLSGLNFYSGGSIISAGTLVAGTTDNQALPAGGSAAYAGLANAAGAFGMPGTTVTMGDANTPASSTPTLLIGGAYTVGHPITVANYANGAYTIGGSTDNNATFSGAITLNQPLTISQVANTGGNTLTISGGITAGSGSQTVTFAGPGTMNVTTTPLANGSGKLGVNIPTGVTLFLGAGAAPTYTGVTTVNGTLDVTGLGGPLTLGSQTLAGSGTINGSLTESAATTNVFNLSASHASGNDQMTVTGTVSGNGARIGINMTGASLDGSGDYVLLKAGSVASGFSSTPVWLGTPPSNYGGFYVLTVGNTVVLRQSPIVVSLVTATPNPATRGQLVTVSVTATTTAPSATISSVVMNASAAQAGATSVTLFQVGATGVYTNSVTVDLTQTPGTDNLSVTINDTATVPNSITLSIPLIIVPPTIVWNGNSLSDNNWSDGANWLGGLVPQTGEYVAFAGVNRLTANMNNNYTLGSLTFSNNAGPFVIQTTSYALTMAGGVENDSTNTETLDASLTLNLNGVQTFNTAAGNIVINGPVYDGTTPDGLIKTGTNTLTLAGANSGYFNGFVTINGGTLVLSGGEYASAAPMTNNAVLQLDNKYAASSYNLVLNSGSTVRLRSDSNNDQFSVTSLTLQNASDTLTFDVEPLTTGSGNTLDIWDGSSTILSMAFTAPSNQTINVTGNSTYTMALGPITLTSPLTHNFTSLSINTLPNGAGVKVPSVTSGTWGNYLNFAGGGRVTVTGNLGNTSSGALNTFVNDGTTVTLLGQTIKSGTGDAFRYSVQNGMLVLDNNGALTNDTTAAGINTSYFFLGAATNAYLAVGTPAPGVLVSTNNSFNAAIYLGDANSSGLFTMPNLTNYVSDGDTTFTNSGVFTIGGQNTSGINTYSNQIILGWTTNRGKGVTLVATTLGEVDFAGRIVANGTDTAAGVNVGDATHKGVVKLFGANTYAGGTTVTNCTLLVANATGSGTGSGSVLVLPNAIFGGNGTITGAVTVNGGTNFPSGSVNNATATNTVGSLTFTNGGKAEFNLSSTYNGANDQVKVTGTLNGNGASVGINLIGGDLDQLADYVLFTNGAVTGNFAAAPVWIGTLPSDSSHWSIVTMANNNVVLRHSAIVASAASVTPNPASHGQRVTISVSATSGAASIQSITVYDSNGANPAIATISLYQVGSTGVWTNSVVVNVSAATGARMLIASITDNATPNNNSSAIDIPFAIINGNEVWKGGAPSNNNWNAGANWASGVSPLLGDYVTFAGNIQLTANMDNNYTLGSLTFSNNAGAFNITGTSVTLTLAGDVVNNSANTQTLSVPVALSGARTFNAASNNIVVNNPVSDNGGGLTKAGTNTLTLAGNNTYTGPTTVSAGALVLSGDNTLATGPVTNSATLQLANASAVKSSSAVTLNSGSTLQLRADADTIFAMTNLVLQNASDTLNFDVAPATSGTGHTLSVTNALAFAANANQAINVTGNSTYTLSLGAVTTTTTSHTPYPILAINTLPAGPALAISSITFGNWGNFLPIQGGGKVTITGNLANTSNGSFDLFVNDGSTLTLQGSSVKVNVGDAFRYVVQNGTLVLDNSSALLQTNFGTGLGAGWFIIGAVTNNTVTNLFTGSGYSAPTGPIVVTNNSYNATVYLGDATHAVGGLSTAANLTNYLSDGDVTFTNSGVFTIGGQNTSGTNTYANPIILGWTANVGKSVTLVAAAGGQVDFNGNILANGTDTTAGVTVGDAAHTGVVRLAGTNTYAGSTTVSYGTLRVGGVIGNGAVTVASGATLGGGGTIGGAVTVASGGNLVPGKAGTSGKVLTINNSLTLNGGSTTTMAVSHNGPTNDQVVSTSVHYGGTLTVITNAGDAALASGDSFQLFKAGSYTGGTFTATNLPALGSGLAWSNSVATDGKLTVVTVSTINPVPPAVQATVLGSTMTLSWPANLGWILQSNSLDLSVSGDWVNYPPDGSVGVTSVNITLDPAKTNVFFRMVKPQ